MAGSAGAQPGPAADGPEILIREMERVVEVGRSRGPQEETMIVGLRSLCDDRLSPLFASLSDSRRWEARVHGVLGLAELDDTEQVSVLVVAQIEDPQVRTVVISEALKQGLVEAAGLREMLAISGLDPSLRLAMLAKLRQLDAEVTPEEVDRVVGELSAGQVGMRVYGMLVAADLRGEDGSSAWAVLDGVASDAAREAILSVVLRQINGDNLDGVTGFVEKAWDWSRGRAATELEVLSAMLSQSIDRGSAAWRELWDRSPALSQRLLLACVLTEFASGAPVSMFEPLVSDPDPFVRRLGVFGAAVAGGGPFGDQLYEVLAGDHRLSTAAALSALGGIEASDRSPSLAIAIRRVLGRAKQGAAPRYAFDMARMVASDDVDLLRALIGEAVASGDARMVELLLTTAVEIDPVEIWEAGPAPPMPDRRTAALAALVVARARLGADLTGPEIEQLRRIAGGRELLPPAMRVQAAWLALCASGQEREALARILAPENRPKPEPALAD